VTPEQTRRARWAGAAGAGIVFALVALYARGPEAAGDVAILAWIRELRSEAMNVVMRAITTLGDFDMVLVLAGVASLVFWRRSWRAVFFTLTAVIGAGILNTAVKTLFARDRPPIAEAVYEPGGFSYPSGHSMGALALALAVALAVSRLWPPRVARVVWIVAGVYAFAIGLSRIYLGVHFPSDVLGGFALSTAWVLLLDATWPRIARRNAVERAPTE
jgi:undecaprenyl-diphosphatase